MPGEVLRKKLQSTQPLSGDAGIGAERAWRVAFARAARDMMQLPVDFVSLSMARLSLPELLDMPPEHALILMLEGPEDSLGLLILSPPLVSAMVEILTIGKCGTQAPEPRKPTRTDAAMLSPLADLALSYLEDALAGLPDLIWVGGFRFASFIEEARPLGLLLEDISYRALTARLSLAQGARTGDMVLVLPADGQGHQAHVTRQPALDGAPLPDFASALAENVEGACCPLDAVLTRLSLPLSAVLRLSVDMMLPLPNAALDLIRCEGLDRRAVGEGRLGQHRGMRALRLTSGGYQAASAPPPKMHSAPQALQGADAFAEDISKTAVQMPAAQEIDFMQFSATGTG